MPQCRSQLPSSRRADAVRAEVERCQRAVGRQGERERAGSAIPDGVGGGVDPPHVRVPLYLLREPSCAEAKRASASKCITDMPRVTRAQP